MSLKAVHLFFVCTFTTLAFGCALWKFMDFFGAHGAAGDLWFGLGSFVVGVVVIVYGRHFLKKLKSISYL
jgi:ABC-type anion transport system duplicated permease subunit